MDFFWQDSCSSLCLVRWQTLGEWCAAIATLGAVLVSLWLARAHNNVRLKISAGHRVVITPGDYGPRPDILSFIIQNVGRVDATIQSLGWEVLGFRRYAFQVLGEPGCPTLPRRLMPDESLQLFITFHTGPEGWVESFADKMLQPHPRLALRLLRIHVYTAGGLDFSAPVETNLREYILEKLAAAAGRGGTGTGQVAQ